jgi:hypothetical protein
LLERSPFNVSRLRRVPAPIKILAATSIPTR